MYYIHTYIHIYTRTLETTMHKQPLATPLVTPAPVEVGCVGGKIDLMYKAWPYASASIFLVIYRVLSWHEWKRAGALYGNLTHDAVLAFLFPVCVLVQQTNWGTYYSTKVSSLVYVKLLWRYFWPVTPVHCYPLIMADFYCACVVPRLMHKLYNFLAN